MTMITDEFMKQMITGAKTYSLVILKATSKWNDPGIEHTVWEHGRRNFALQEDGLLSIVCPINDETNVKGIGIFNATLEEVKTIMDEDPAVKAGIFEYELHPCKSFPGDCLPK